MTWTTLPILCFDSVFVAMILSFKGFSPADNFRELLRDLRLPSAVVGALQERKHIAAGVGGVLHCGPPGPVLGGPGLAQRPAHLVRPVERKDLVADSSCPGLTTA